MVMCEHWMAEQTTLKVRCLYLQTLWTAVFYSLWQKVKNYDLWSESGMQTDGFRSNANIVYLTIQGMQPKPPKSDFLH